MHFALASVRPIPRTSSQNLLPRSVVVEHNGEAVAPSEFSKRPIKAGDTLEIVKIVAGG
jgi:thiamine biosynthesis protein ThiS